MHNKSLFKYQKITPIKQAYIERPKVKAQPGTKVKRLPPIQADN